MNNQRHHSLIAWQRADALVIKLHRLTSTRFPATERFELGSQLGTCAALSPRALAFSQHLAELVGRGRILRARRLGYIDDALVQELEPEINSVGAPLASLVRSHESRPHAVRGPRVRDRCYCLCLDAA